VPFLPVTNASLGIFVTSIEAFIIVAIFL